MKPVEEIEQQLLTALTSWKENGKPLVVAIEGYPGAGKTTLADSIESESFKILRQDEYLFSLDKRLRLLKSSSNVTDAVILDFYDNRRLNKDLAALQRSSPKQTIIVEGVFLFDPRRYRGVWDKQVYISVDKELADFRRVKREKARWGNKYMPEGDPRALFPLITRIYSEWTKQVSPEKMADLVLKAS